MASFLEKLRMNSIYGGNPFAPKQESPFNLLDQFKKRLPQDTGLDQISQQITAPLEEEPRMAYSMGITPYQQAQLELRRGEQGLRERMGESGIESREKIASEREATRRSELAIREKRAEVYEFKAKNPGSKFMQGKDGILRAINPITNQVFELGVTGMSDKEIDELNQKQALEIVGAKGTEARTTQREGHEQTVEEIEARAKEARKTKEAPGEVKPELPTQTRTKQWLRAQEALNTHPGWEKYIQIVGNGFVLRPPKRFTGRDEETYNKVKEFIYGDKPTPNESKPAAKDNDPFGIRK